MEDDRFSLDLGPELDPPETDKWGWLEGSYEDEPRSPKNNRKDRTYLGRAERKAARQRKGPKSIPPRSLPPLAEVVMDPEPTVLDESLRDSELDDIQTIAEEAVVREQNTKQ